MTEPRPTSVGNAPLRLALLGLGKVTDDIHLPACALLSGAQLVAGCEPNEERRAQVAQRGVLSALYPDAETLLQKEKPDIVLIATPPHTHRDLCLLALEHGAHVFCEKPFVCSIAEADEVIAAAEQHRLSVVVNNQYRFMPIYRETRERMTRGEFGQPFFIQCWQQMYHPPAMEANWRAQLTQSTLFEFGTHPLDLICYFFDALPLSIQAHTPHPRPDITSDVLVQATLRFPGERLATLSMNRISHAAERYLEMRVDCEKASLRLSFGGVARAAVDWSRALGRPIARVSFVKGGEARAEQGGRSLSLVREKREARPSAMARNLQELVDAVCKGTANNDRARHARELMRIVFAGYESARAGETVWLREPSGGDG